MSDTVLLGAFVGLISIISTYFLTRRSATATIISTLQKTLADVMLLQSSQIGEIAGLRKEATKRDSELASIKVILKATTLQSRKWQKLAEDRLVKLDGMPDEIIDLKEQLKRKDRLEDERSAIRLTEAQNLTAAQESIPNAENGV